MVVEIKNSVVVLLGLVLVIGFALLPAAIIYWVAFGVLIIGALGLLIYYGFWALRSKANTNAAIITLLVLAAIGSGALLIVGLFYLIVVGIVVFLLPTVINLGISYLTVQLLPSRHFLVIPVFLIVSLALAFNVRIPGMIDDWSAAKKMQQASVTRMVQISPDEPLLVVSNIEQISFRASPNETIGLGGNEGCMCLYWTYPRTITEEVEDALQRSGIRYKKSGDARYRLVIDSREKDGITFLVINLWDGSQNTASYSTRLRTYYPYEEEFGKGHTKDLDYFPYRLLFLTQSTLWNDALSAATHAMIEHPIRSFLEKSIVVIPPSWNLLVGVHPTNATGEVEPLKTFQRNIGERDYAEIIRPVEVECGDKIKTGYRNDTTTYGAFGLNKATGLTGRTVTFKDGMESFTVLIKRDPEKVICTTNVVYVIGALTNQEVRIQKFSRRGGLLADHVIALPEMTFVGFPRKPIIEFSESGERYEFTLLDIAEEGSYYAVKGAYRIRAPLNNQAIQPGIDP